MSQGTGPLRGVRVIELGAIGPAPFAGMMLSDMGAEVIRVGRLGDDERAGAATHGVLNRGRRWMQVDLKSASGVAIVRDLVAGADVLTEGFRPGVAERLGLGPADLLAVNPALVYGRMTGWGQDGPLAHAAGHDINYIALSGVLAPVVGDGGRPVPPLNMLGDFGGGGMLLAVGVLGALLHARATGEGQVVDAAIVDGAALLTSMHQAMLASGMWAAPAGHNLFDGGAPFYGVYRTADDRWLSVGAIEPKFYAALLTGLGLELDPAQQMDTSTWPHTRELIAERIVERTRDEWVRVFAETDACVAPVLEPAETARDEHLRTRETYVSRDGLRHPAPAPRFGSTPGTLPTRSIGSETAALLREIGRTEQQIAALRDSGVIE